MKLFYREFGGKGPNIIIFHGLFGSSDNWLPQAKMLSSHYHVYLPDLRNHGQSPHAEEFTYKLMAEDIREFIQEHQISDPVLIGHSMGGKAVMTLATHYPEIPSRLIIVDIGPKEYGKQHDNILKGLLSIRVAEVKSRAEADEALAQYVDQAAVRQFLLKNLLRKPEGGFGWKMILEVISRHMSSVGDAVEKEKSFKRPVLFIRGARSSYIGDNDMMGIHALFPKARLLTLDTGHWVQAEKPEELVDAVVEFMQEESSQSD